MRKKVRNCGATGTPAETGNTMVGKARAFGSFPPHPGGLGSEEEGILPSGGQFGVLQPALHWKAHFPASHLAIFQRLMNSILSDLIYCTWGVYFDDVIINSLSCELYRKDLNEVLVRTKETGITIKCKKCQF